MRYTHPKLPPRVLPKQIQPTTEQVVKIGREYFDKGSIVLSAETGLSSTKIMGIVGYLRKKGVVIPHRPKTIFGMGTDVYKEALRQLKNK